MPFQFFLVYQPYISTAANLRLASAKPKSRACKLRTYHLVACGRVTPQNFRDSATSSEVYSGPFLACGVYP